MTGTGIAKVPTMPPMMLRTTERTAPRLVPPALRVPAAPMMNSSSSPRSARTTRTTRVGVEMSSPPESQEMRAEARTMNQVPGNPTTTRKRPSVFRRTRIPA